MNLEWETFPFLKTLLNIWNQSRDSLETDRAISKRNRMSDMKMIHSPSTPQQVGTPRKPRLLKVRLVTEIVLVTSGWFFMTSPFWHTLLKYHCIFFLILQILSFAAFLCDRFTDSQFFCWTLLLCFCNCWEYDLHLHTWWRFLIQSWTGLLTSVVLCYLSPLRSLLLLESRSLRSFCHFLFFHFQHWGKGGSGSIS